MHDIFSLAGIHLFVCFFVFDHSIALSLDCMKHAYLVHRFPHLHSSQFRILSRIDSFVQVLWLFVSVLLKRHFISCVCVFPAQIIYADGKRQKNIYKQAQFACSANHEIFFLLAHRSHHLFCVWILFRFFLSSVRRFCRYFKINLLAIDYLLARRPITH